MVEFIKATALDAETIVATRQKVWNTTYRGIYPDSVIDDFDWIWHREMECRRLCSADYSCWLVLDGVNCVGYFSCGRVKPGMWKDYSFRLYSLYLLPAYQGKGLGKRAFLAVREICLTKGCEKLFLDCHPKNEKALSFYRHMGGRITNVDTGHPNSQEDSCTVEFEFT